MRTIILALTFLTIAGPSNAENCKPPNVARTVYPLLGSGGSITLENRIPSWQLACPGEGPCQRVYEHGMETRLDVVCLSPKDNTEAEARWR